LGTVGIILYVIAMWVSSGTQGLMWRATNADGSLTYPGWVETVVAIRPMYIVRALGGTMYLTGFVMMAWNLWKTARAGQPVTVSVEVVVEDRAAAAPNAGVLDVLKGGPRGFSLVGMGAVALLAAASSTRE